MSRSLSIFQLHLPGAADAAVAILLAAAAAAGSWAQSMERLRSSSPDGET